MRLTSDRQKYSLVTESNVSTMFQDFCGKLRLYPAIYPLLPYRDIGDKMGTIQTQWFKDIMEVVNTIESPPMLKAGDYTRLLIKIISNDPFKDCLLPELNLESFSYSRDEYSHPRLKINFDKVVNRVIDLVKQLMIGQFSDVLRPFSNFDGRVYMSDISPEVRGLINFAEVRRIALGSRFISRSHFLWAFYERGYVFPPHIRETIKLTSADEDHPPYHIYMASIKLAKHFSEKVRLETFIFCVINSEHIGLSADRSELFKIIGPYEDFLKALDNPSSNFRSSGPKRLRSGELKF